MASGQFVAPDHAYPSYLELRRRVRDAAGATPTRRAVAMQPDVVDLTFESAPAGLQLVVGSEVEGRPVRQAADRRLEQLGERFITAAAQWTEDTRFRAGLSAAPSRTTPSRLSRRQRIGQSSSRCRYQQLPSREGTLPKATPVRRKSSFTVTLAPATGNTVTVNYATRGDTVLPGTDFGQVSGTLTFGPGTTTLTVAVPVSGDVIDEANETVTLTLSAPTNAVIGTAVVQGTIADDDGPPSVTISDVTVVEGNSGTVNAVFVVSLSAPSAFAVDVYYTTVGGTAASGQDFRPVAGTLTIAPGSTTAPITVLVLGDMLREPSEFFRVDLKAPHNATLLDASGVGKISDNDKGKR